MMINYCEDAGKGKMRVGGVNGDGYVDYFRFSRIDANEGRREKGGIFLYLIWW